jgi:undecaprenyl-diphosphatase
VPTLAGATILQLFKHRDAITPDALSLIGIGFVVSFVVAFLVIKGFLAVVSRFGFAPFAWYRIIAGAIALVWLLNR